VGRPLQNKTLKILTINFGGIGDEILFLPTLESIRKAHPSAHLTLLLEPRSRSFEQVTNLIDATITFDIKKRPLLPTDLLQLLSLIRSGKYDMVISSGGSPQVAALLFLSGIKERIGYASNKIARNLLTKQIPLNKNQYAAAMYQDLATGIGQAKLPESECIPRAILKSGSLKRMEEFLSNAFASTKKHRIIIHPGTSRLAVQKNIIKTWNNDNWVDLINKLRAREDLEIVIAGGPDDEETIAALMPKLATGNGLISAIGHTKSLADLGALISFCDLLICVDSAPMHLAVALGTPVVAMFGPTDESLLLPPLSKYKALRDKPLSEKPRTMQDGLGVHVKPDVVLQAVDDQLKALQTAKY
jgi:ADP-heptose:LPS heptosyltransferase